MQNFSHDVTTYTVIEFPFWPPSLEKEKPRFAKTQNYEKARYCLHFSVPAPLLVRSSFSQPEEECIIPYLLTRQRCIHLKLNLSSFTVVEGAVILVLWPIIQHGYQIHIMIKSPSWAGSMCPLHHAKSSLEHRQLLSLFSWHIFLLKCI